MVCIASKPKPKLLPLTGPVLRIPTASANAADQMMMRLMDAGVPLDAMDSAAEARDSADPNKSGDWDLSLATAIFCAGALAGMALVELARWL